MRVPEKFSPQTTGKISYFRAFKNGPNLEVFRPFSGSNPGTFRKLRLKEQSKTRDGDASDWQSPSEKEHPEEDGTRQKVCESGGGPERRRGAKRPKKRE